ncbi:MAG TPA: hypothetical protein VD865_03245 [Stenotrophomonas sp.]|nr:hypothetical protein [Stenotrophomonas sp.]
MQTCVVSRLRLDRDAFRRLRLRQYEIFLWLACVSGSLFALGSIARISGFDSDFVMSAWGHLFLVALPLALLLAAAVLTLIAAEAGMPARPILLRAHKPRTPPVPAASWPASTFERPPRRALAA